MKLHICPYLILSHPSETGRHSSRSVLSSARSLTPSTAAAGSSTRVRALPLPATARVPASAGHRAVCAAPQPGRQAPLHSTSARPPGAPARRLLQVAGIPCVPRRLRQAADILAHHLRRPPDAPPHSTTQCMNLRFPMGKNETLAIYCIS